MRRIYFTKQELSDIITSYKRGESIVSISNRFGVDRGTIIRRLTDEGIYVIPPYNRYTITEKWENKLIELYNSGYSCEMIADIYGMGAMTIWNYLQKLGINTKPVRYKFNYNYFDIIDTEAKAYWLGFISTDGNVYKNTLKIGLSIKDSDHLKKFLMDVDSNHPVLIYNDCAEVKLTSNVLVNTLLKYGIVPNKSLILKPYYDIPPHLARHYWRGFIDGDGHLGIRRSHDSYYYPIISLAGTKEVCEQFKRFSQEIFPNNNKIFKQKNIFIYGVSGKKAKVVIDTLYTNSNT